MPEPEIVVNLMTRTGHNFIDAYWTDPVSGLRKFRTTGTTKQREAERFRAQLEVELNDETNQVNSSASWKTAADRYEAENLASRAKKTLAKFRGTRNKWETHINPKLCSSINSSVVSQFQAKLRAEKLAEATIKSHLAHLKACFGWLNRMGFLKRMPLFDMPKRTDKMRGRAITEEEFDRICEALNAKKKNGHEIPIGLRPEWKRLLTGLWLSGLRLGEALKLRWDSGEIQVNISGPPEAQKVRLKIQANTDKSTQFRILPLAPEFAEFLLQTPPNERRGRVFRPIVPGQVAEMRLDTCSKFIERLGKQAGVIEDERPGDKPGETIKKFASAHSFRRAFGTRWASQRRMRPQELKILMRHKDIKTTMTFYADTDAETVEIAFAAFEGNKTGNKPEKQPQPTPSRKTTNR